MRHNPDHGIMRQLVENDVVKVIRALKRCEGRHRNEAMARLANCR